MWYIQHADMLLILTLVVAALYAWSQIRPRRDRTGIFEKGEPRTDPARHTVHLAIDHNDRIVRVWSGCRHPIDMGKAGGRRSDFPPHIDTFSDVPIQPDMSRPAGNELYTGRLRKYRPRSN